jgi:threonine dehydrogenase-like Zn-dependent dehydrogenase
MPFWGIVYQSVDAKANVQSKNRVNFGRVPVRKVFHEALECLLENRSKLANFVTHDLPLSEASRGFAIFEKQMARKVVLRP